MSGLFALCAYPTVLPQYIDSLMARTPIYCDAVTNQSNKAIESKGNAKSPEEVIKMDDKRFGPENNENEESELERYLNNTAKFQTVNYPQQFNTYDPWAGWYKSSVDMGAKWEEYYGQLEKMKSTDNFGTNYPVYEEPPPEIRSDQFENNLPVEEGTYPFAPATGEVNPENSVNSYPPVVEETQESLPEVSEAPAPSEQQVTKEEAPEEQTTDEQKIETQTTEEKTKEPVAQGEEEPTASSPQVIVWKNFPPNI